MASPREELLLTSHLAPQVSEMEVNGQFESVCESVFSELESQVVEALDLPMPGCFRMRSHSYVRAIEKGCSQDDECVSLRSSSPPRTTTTVRTIQSSTGECAEPAPRTPPPRAAPQLSPDAARGPLAGITRSPVTKPHPLPTRHPSLRPQSGTPVFLHLRLWLPPEETATRDSTGGRCSQDAQTAS